MIVKSYKVLFLVVLAVLLLLPALSVIGGNNDPRRVANKKPDFSDRVPIVYHDNYNITFLGIEKLHPFDSTKYAHVFHGLRKNAEGLDENIIRAAKPDDDMINATHSKRYLQSIRDSGELARIAELHALSAMPDAMAWTLLADRMLYQSGGSVMAAQAALQHGWAINLGGGFHHASRDHGEGFCVFADISMVVHAMRKQAGLKRIMIIDLDAHQGNGHSRDFIDDADIYILDAYNTQIYPQDDHARKGVDLAVELTSETPAADYLPRINAALDLAFAASRPELVIYVAGTDVLAGDPLGQMQVTPDMVIKRDEMVFARAREHGVPVVMLLAGGYQRNTAEVITNSILNLREKFKLF